MDSLAPAPSPMPSSAPVEPDIAVKSISLTPDMLMSAGLTDLKPGDEVSLKFSSDGDDGSKNFEVTVEPSMQELSDPVSEEDPEERMLGYKRPKPSDMPFPKVQGLKG